MNNSPTVITELNLSDAWCAVVKTCMECPGKEITPLLLSLTNFSEDDQVRCVLDNHLDENRQTSIDTVSETIFPKSLYELCGQNRHALFEEYKQNLPRIRKIDKANARGTYFQRLIDYDGKNQLEIIISSVLEDASIRRSKLQASIFDANKDHINGPYQGFPCLQHITFLVSNNGGLVMNSFYAKQLLYRKAYGNWLGLINLGQFIAKELQIEMEKFNCFVGVEELEITKTEAKDLLESMNKLNVHEVSC